MTIEEMHIAFRELGQQMGIQITRAIFPENIDICINFAIDAKTRSILRENVGTGFPDKVARDNAKVSAVNGLYTLQRYGELTGDDIFVSGSDKDRIYSPYTAIIETKDVYLFTGFDCVFTGHPNKSVYPCRIIERELIYNTIHDYCNRPSKSNPIITTASDGENLIINIYTGIVEPAAPYSILYKYIGKPKMVFLDEENPDNSIDCDLPAFLHKDIVTDAVNFYLQSLNVNQPIRGNNN